MPLEPTPLASAGLAHQAAEALAAIVAAIPPEAAAAAAANPGPDDLDDDDLGLDLDGFGDDDAV
jgi:hypothetical protein